MSRWTAVMRPIEPLPCRVLCCLLTMEEKRVCVLSNAWFRRLVCLMWGQHEGNA